MKKCFLLVSLVFLMLLRSLHGQDTNVHIRINQVGYLPNDPKTAIIFSNRPVKEAFKLIREDGSRQIQSFRPEKMDMTGWGTFSNYYKVDFSKIKQTD